MIKFIFDHGSIHRRFIQLTRMRLNILQHGFQAVEDVKRDVLDRGLTVR